MAGQEQLITSFEKLQLDEVHLTPEEEWDLENNYEVLYFKPVRAKYCSFDKETSDEGSSSGSECAQTADPQFDEYQIALRGRQCGQPSNQLPCLSFIDFVVQHPTHEWNDKAETVYKSCNATIYVVDPNHLLSISFFEDKMDYSIENIMEKIYLGSPKTPWESVANLVENILSIYDNFDELADRLGDKHYVRKKAADFCLRVRKLAPKGLPRRYLAGLIRFAELFKESHTLDEELYEKYVTAVIQMFSFITNLCLCVDRQSTLYLPLPPDKGGRKVKERKVRPDIQVCREGIILVGEVKPFGAHGQRFEKHRGIIPKSPKGLCREAKLQESGGKAGEDMGEARGEQQSEDQRPSKEGQSGEEQQVKKMRNYVNSSCFFRDVNKKELFKLRCALPQHLGQSLAALQHNELRYIHLGNRTEMIQLGFIVEGFKLRFVKLCLFKTSGDHRMPSPQEVFTGESSCEVFITQEFNLFKARHLRMFFVMLQAICYACEEMGKHDCAPLGVM